MNFEECYKKANNEITGDKALLEKILNAPGKEKTKIIPMVYKASSLAAAIVLVGVIALSTGLGRNINKSEEAAMDTVPMLSEESETFNVCNESVLADVTAGETEESADSTSKNATVMRNINAEEKTISAAEAISRAGIDYDSLMIDGMTLSGDWSWTDFSPEGDLLMYEIELAFENGDKSVNVRLTNSESDIPYSVTEAGGFVTAQKTFMDTDIFITAKNIAKAEIENYISSIS